MGKKTGKKASFVVWNGKEIRDVINGMELGVSLNQRTNSYYMMIPKELAGKGAKRSKQIWLKSDLGNAVVKFWAIVSELKGAAEKTTAVSVLPDTVETYITVDDGKPMYVPQRMLEHYLDNVSLKNVKVHRVEGKITEQEHVTWLKQMLENPSDLAKLTGIEAFNNFWDYIRTDPIKLSTLIDNFFSMRKKPITPKEKQKTEKAWEIFCDIANKKTVEEITLQDVRAYEDYIHSRNFAPKTISHYLNRVEKVFSYNTEKYQNNEKLIRISKWCRGMERLDDTAAEAPEIVTLEDFELLYNNTDLLLAEGKRNSPNINLAMKAMLVYGLNTASTFIDLSRLTKEEIDLKERTLSSRRHKVGQVKKVAYLWERTVKDLQAYLKSRKDNSPYVFLSRTGTAYTDSGLRKIFKRYKQLINDKLKAESKDKKNAKQITIDFKHLRDTFSGIAKDLDIDAFKVNCVMGHSNKGMVDKYSKRQITNNLKEACLKVEQEFFQIEG